MSNPSICYLVQDKIFGVYFSVEDNLGESIHIHYGNSRFDMKIEEFLSFARCVQSAACELLSIRGIKWERFSKGNFKKEWMCRYKYILDINKVSVPLKTLHIKESYAEKRSIKKYIPLRESGYIPFFAGKSDDEAYYEESGVYDLSRAQKAIVVQNKIQKNGYPDDEGFILIDQEGYILDGVKRASYMYYLHGGDYVIPALEIKISWEKGLSARVEDAKKQIEIYEQTKIEAQKTVKKEILTSSLQYTLRDILSAIKMRKIRFLIINGSNNNQFNCDKYILIENRYDEVVQIILEYTDAMDTDGDEFGFAYANHRPIFILTDEGRIMIHDKYLVKSKFYPDMIMPLDRKVQSWLWMNRVKDGENMYVLRKEALWILAVIISILSGEHIHEEIQTALTFNKAIWLAPEVKEIIQKIFFSYGARVVEFILNDRFDDAVDNYIKFAEY